MIYKNRVRKINYNLFINITILIKKYNIQTKRIKNFNNLIKLLIRIKIANKKYRNKKLEIKVQNIIKTFTLKILISGLIVILIYNKVR